MLGVIRTCVTRFTAIYGRGYIGVTVVSLSYVLGLKVIVDSKAANNSLVPFPMDCKGDLTINWTYIKSQEGRL